MIVILPMSLLALAMLFLMIGVVAYSATIIKIIWIMLAVGYATALIVNIIRRRIAPFGDPINLIVSSVLIIISAVITYFGAKYSFVAASSISGGDLTGMCNSCAAFAFWVYGCLLLNICVVYLVLMHDDDIPLGAVGMLLLSGLMAFLFSKV